MHHFFSLLVLFECRGFVENTAHGTRGCTVVMKTYCTTSDKVVIIMTLDDFRFLMIAILFKVVKNVSLIPHESGLKRDTALFSNMMIT